MITTVSNFYRGKRKRATALGVGFTVFLGAAAWAAALFVAAPAPVNYVSSGPAHFPVMPLLDPREAQAGADLSNPQAPLLVIHDRKERVPFVLIEGGVAQTRRATLRCGVDQFVQKAGAQAGLNGTFFCRCLPARHGSHPGRSVAVRQ